MRAEIFSISPLVGRVGVALGLISILWGVGIVARAGAAPTNSPAAVLLSKQGTVDYARSVRAQWVTAPVGQMLEVYDRLRTLELSRAAVRLKDFSVLQVDALSTLEMRPPRNGSAEMRLELSAGALYFLHRDKPGEIEVTTPTVTAAIEGTEFILSVEGNGRTVLTLIDGKVGLANALGSLVLTNGEQGIVDPGQPPRKTAVISTINLIQWCLYYPGVLDPEEVGLTDPEKAILAPSLGAYAAGDLLQAVATYTAARTLQPAPAKSPGESVYYAAILLAVGDVPAAESLLTTQTTPQASSLRRLIAAVKLQEIGQPMPAHASASELLAQSYYLQSQYDLSGALKAAQSALKLSTNFAFGWERVAELEFSFGRLPQTEQALDRALKLAPRHAQAHVLKGFVRLGRSEIDAALGSFAEAIRIDPALANGWLGRGLCRIRKGRSDEGLRDIQTAAAMEPNRWLLRSYLAKAYSQSGQDKKSHRERTELTTKAKDELRLAEREDPKDPTPWLYSALLNYRRNRTAAAVDDLEKSILLNDNRLVYRSRLLLDQDLAVRGAKLANIYESAAMPEVSLRESVRAVSYDYSHFESHLNLASSFNALRDPTRFNLRYESEWFNEHLLANLLQPIGSGPLSQHLSQEEYSGLFVGRPLGFTSTTEYFGNGEVRQLASQFGTFGNSSYALDLDYQYKSGIRPNNDLSRIEWYTRIKHKLTDQDSLFVLTKYQDYESGDNFQYYDPAQASADFRFTEKQMPILLAGYHREWNPNAHTLFLAGRLINDQAFSDKKIPQVIIFPDATSGTITNVAVMGISNGLHYGGMDIKLRSQFEIYTAELQQLFSYQRQSDILGARFQIGDFSTSDLMTLDVDQFHQYFTNLFTHPPAAAEIDEAFQRITAYGYHTLELFDHLLVTAGLSYDQVNYPKNFRHPPISSGKRFRSSVSPKTSLIWTPRPEVTVRGAYSRALGGVSYDESVRLEPTHLVGFSQAFRSLISESLVGSVAAPLFETYGLGLDMKLPSRTYLGIEGTLVNTDLKRTVGVFSFSNPAYPLPITDSVTPASIAEELQYQEKSVKATFNQIFSEEWFVQAQYKFTRSRLNSGFPAIPPSVSPSAESSQRAELHQLGLSALYKHPSGVFARGESWWFRQKNYGYTPALPGDDFVQFNVFIGYEFPYRRGELAVGLLNVTAQDYRLNPLNIYAELPRSRLFYARLKLNF